MMGALGNMPRDPLSLIVSFSAASPTAAGRRLDGQLSDFDDKMWNSVSAAAVGTIPLSDTSPTLVLPEMPPVRRFSPRAPSSVSETPDGKVLVDCGLNMAGTVEIRFQPASISPGRTVKLRRAEGVMSDGRTLNPTWLLHGARENCSYTFRGDGSREVYADRFSYFGFRYLELDGIPAGAAPSRDDITCYFVHTDLEQSSLLNFTGNNEAAALLNEVQGMITRSALSNYVSHPTDCPSREKRGWTGDGGHAAETLIMNFNMGAPYAKWLQDIADATAQSGNDVVPDMAPFLFGNGHEASSDPAWGAGFITTLHSHYKYYGDASVVATHYDTAEAYIKYLSRYAPKELLTTAYPGTKYGDWCAPSGSAIHPSTARHTSNVISGYFWIKQLDMMAFLAGTVLGKTSAAEAFAARAAKARAAFRALYFDRERGIFRDPTWSPPQGVEVFQTEQALAITLLLDSNPDMISKVKQAAEALKKDVKLRLDVGMVGIKHLLPALTAVGAGEVALAVLSSKDYPGYGYMAEHGEGALWERWEEIDT